MSLERWNDIDYLRKNARSINFFGLGFVQVKMSPTERLHLYHPDVPMTVDAESIHNHRYTFTSHVLKGLLKQSLYIVQQDILGDCVLSYESCQAGVEPPERHDQVTVTKTAELHLPVGSSYTLDYKTLHRVEAVGKTVTRILRPEDYEVRFAEVVKPLDAPRVCPFQTELTEEELWTYAEDTLR